MHLRREPGEGLERRVLPRDDFSRLGAFCVDAALQGYRLISRWQLWLVDSGAAPDLQDADLAARRLDLAAPDVDARHRRPLQEVMLQLHQVELPLPVCIVRRQRQESLARREHASSRPSKPDLAFIF